MVFLPVILLVAASASGYDANLCITAQRSIVNALPDSFEIEVLTGESNGFHVIQMDARPGIVTIATTSGSIEIDGGDMPAWVACKMVNRERVNDVLELQLQGERRSCRSINEATYELALSLLSPEQKSRYTKSGRKLIFADDYVAASGAEWLPSVVDDYIRSSGQGLNISAPSVQVPWNADTREFYQGTHHCKLITLAAMQHWMLATAFTDSKQLFPRSEPECREPVSMTSAVGSCKFWFAPAGAMFCQDYSGNSWTTESARSECAKRHASPEALAAADSRYEGVGGIYDAQSCVDRDDSPDPVGTCVFHCRAEDETLWHTLEPDSGGATGAAMMRRACDLFLER